jgi:eukaryotic-like serine/threonine-protein kinase
MAKDQPSLESIFCTAIEIESAEQRREYVAQASGQDSELLRQVDRLLQAHFGAGSFLESPLDGVAPSSTLGLPMTEKPGNQIGPYKLLQQIGEGGMGVVYMAEQHQPVRRKVALKIIKPGMDSRQVIARFEAERQALAMMDYPNIAKVLDAGTTESGRPYFVMELVKGPPITQYCDEHRLTPRQRLELLLPICQAIQHAHQKGIIHRDIKPTNILVAEYDQQPVPKVIDFGVAKATSQPLTEKTMFTGFGQIVGTLEYMSPEQAKVNQLDIDTRSDLYSLGVLLYELLTGATPFDKQRLRSAAWDEMLRIIREEEPPKPSTRLSDSKDSLPSISSQRRTEPAKLTKLVRGELDWIVMKALEKDRARRYETASAFADDIRRYLDDLPVLACPPSSLYRLRKFVHLHRIPVLTAVAFAVVLILTTAISLQLRHQAIVARRAAQLSAQEEQQARKIVAEQKLVAVAAAENARQHLYLAEMNLVEKAMEAGRLQTARGLLAHYAPGSADAKLRGFEWHYWNRRCNTVALRSTIPTYAHQLAISRDDGTLATAFLTQGASRLDLWNLDGTCRQSLSALAGAVALSRDGKRLASASLEFEPHRLSIWDTATGTRLQEIPTAEVIFALEYTGDDRRIAAASSSGVDLLDAADGTVIRKLTAVAETVTCMDISSDAETVVAGCSSGAAIVWKASEAAESQPVKLAAHRDRVRSIRLVPGVSAFVTCSADGSICLWDTDSQKPLWRTVLDSAQLTATAVSPDGKILLAGDAKGLVHVLNLEAGLEDLRFVADRGFLSGILFLTSGKEFITGGLDVKRWSLEPPSSRTMISEAAEALAVAPDGDTLACNNGLRSIHRRTRVPLKTSEAILAADFSDDGRRLVTGSNQGSVCIWDPVSGELLQQLRGHTRHVPAVDFSADGTLVASGSLDHSVRIWDLRRPETPVVVTAHPTPVTCVHFSPTGQLLATAQGDRRVRLWNPRTGDPVGTLPEFPAIVQHLRFSSDGAMLAASADNVIRLWNVAAAQPIRELSGHEDLIWSFEFSPDGATLASASQDRSLKLWDVRHGCEKASFKFADGVRNVKFSADGSALYVASEGKLAILYGAELK